MFSFRTGNDGLVNVWHSPLDHVVRLRVDIPPTVSFHEAHLLEHCLVEAHRRDVVHDRGTIAGTTTPTRVSVTLLLPPEVNLTKYVRLTAIDISPELITLVLPLIDEEMRRRRFAVADHFFSTDRKSELADKLTLFLRSLEQYQALQIIHFYSTGLVTPSSEPPVGNGDTGVAEDAPHNSIVTGVDDELQKYVRNRLEHVIPIGHGTHWDDPHFCHLAKTRFACLLKYPSFYTQELDKILDHHWDHFDVNNAFAMFPQQVASWE